LAREKVTSQVRLMPLAFFGDRAGQFHELRHFEAHLVFDDFDQREVGGAEVAGVGHERAAQLAGAGIELADAPGNQIDQNVGVANFLQCLFYKFSVQSVGVSKSSGVH
jgi:hypothetical protein